MSKAALIASVLARLNEDLRITQEAARAAREAATHEESVAENKYDTFGLESAYLAEGQSRRVQEIEQAISTYRNLPLPVFNEDSAVQLSALVRLESDQGLRRTFFLGPAAAGLKLHLTDEEVLIITPKSPLGQNLIGKFVGDQLVIPEGKQAQTYEITEIA